MADRYHDEGCPASRKRPRWMDGDCICKSELHLNAGSAHGKTLPDLTPAEARAEVEAFLGSEWDCCVWPGEGALCMAKAELITHGWPEIRATERTYRAAVDALKAAWRDAVRPWVADASTRAPWDSCHRNIARVLKEDSK